MLPSSRALASHILRGVVGGGKTSTANAALRKIRQSSRVPLVLVAVATGIAGGYTIASNEDNDNMQLTAQTTSLRMMPMPTLVSHCDATPSRAAKLQRKKTAVAASLQRLNTRQQVNKLRTMKEELLHRWQKDEEGWRNLPARAWPEYQPNQQQLEGIVAEVERLGCSQRVLSEAESEKAKLSFEDKPSRFSWFGLRRNPSCSIAQCTKLLFDMATGLLFYQVDPETGFALYEALAKRGHTDAMVACGIVLVEGLGVPPREHEGIAWLETAMKAHDQNNNAQTVASMAQASYELGCVYYTGIDDVVEEDAEKAFRLFQKAAEQDHTAALYMVADCLVEGDGTERNVSAAVPLFYKAAEGGHRYSRQRIRELLQHGNYPE